MFKVLASGPQALFQDAGRSGYMSSGVSPSGAFDRASAVQANRVVGNAPGATVVEILFGGFSVEALTAATVVFTGTNALVHVELPNGYQYIEYTHTIIDVQPGTRLSIQHSRGCAHISRCVVGLLPRRCWAARRPTCSVLSVLISCVLVTRWLSALMYLALAGTPGCGIVRLFEP